MAYLLRVRERLFGRPLLLTPEYANVVVTALADRLGVDPLVSGEMLDKYRRPSDRPVLDRRNGIVTYPVVGSMVHRGDGVQADSGVQSYTAMQNDLTALLEDNSVRGILLDLDTPGGEAAGISELTEWMIDAQKTTGKPIWGIANTAACSGGYWLGAACSKLYAAKMSAVGSIGVVTMHTDVSKALDKRGIVTTYIYAGKHKIDGNPSEALSEDVKAGIQTKVDALYGEFVGAVASMRGIDEAVVRKTEAGVFSPAAALEIGLIDNIGSLGTTLKAFHEELAGPKYSTGFNLEGQMPDKTFTDADVARARAEGVTEGAAAFRAEVATALTSFAASDPRIALFAEGLTDNLSAATAAKFAAKIEAPKAPVAPVAKGNESREQLVALIEAHAPNISADGGTTLDPKAARIAELTGAMKYFNKAQGYSA
jgi:signal peptide peptidase SppA